MTEKLIYRVSESPFNYIGWPSIAKDEKGVIYIVCSGHRLGHVCPFGQSWMFISEDNCETFRGPIIINDTVMDDRDTGLTYLGNGKMVLTWFSHPASAYEENNREWLRSLGDASVIGDGMAEYWKKYEGDCGSFMRISEDYGKTWGKKIKVPLTAPHGVVVAPDGELLYVGKEFRSGTELEKDEMYAIKSGDCGLTWKTLGKIPHTPGFENRNVYDDEAHTVILPGGRILTAMRLEGEVFSVALTHSDDGGKNWSVPVNTDWEGSPPHLLLHSSGDIICVYGHRKAPQGECARISRDGGVTFGDEIYLSHSDSGDLGYPATVELADGSLFTVYYQRYGNDGYPSLMGCRWSL